MAHSTIAFSVAAVCFLAVAAIVFYKTIITKEWRNRVVGESESWRGGVFYYNPSDNRLLLPKRTGLGWTINFGRPLAVVITLLSAIGIAALAVAL
jgi:uncharacterized membrane protein